MKITSIDNTLHRNATDTGTEGHPHAASINIIPLVLSEITKTSLNLPVVLVKDSYSGRFYSTALMGLKDAENLIYNKHGWNTAYIPLNIKRVPFAIGESQKGDGSLGPCIDDESQYVQLDGGLESSGERLFDNQGNKTTYLKSAESFLANLYEQELASQHFINTLTSLKLIVPLSVKMSQSDGTHPSLSGLYTVSEKRLKALSDEQSLDLFRGDYLNAIYAMIASLGQVNHLVQLRNMQHENKIQAAELTLDD